MALYDEPYQPPRKRPLSSALAGATAAGVGAMEQDSANNEQRGAQQAADPGPGAPKTSPKPVVDTSEPWAKTSRGVNDSWAGGVVKAAAASNPATDSWAVHYGQQEAAARQQAVAPAANPNTLPADATRTPDTRGF